MNVKNDRAAWLKGPACKCSSLPVAPARAYRLVLLGAPGVGKGTQAELLCKQLGTCHLSTGDVFRAAKSLSDAERSAAMTSALLYMRRGELVPDKTVLDMIAERSDCLECPGGFLLDGFPRTVAQAQALDELMAQRSLGLDAVLDYVLPIEQIVKRLSGRRTCSGCKAVFHVETKPSRVKDVCDNCGAALVQREDDQPQAIRVRMDAYARSTSPLTEFYKRKGLLVSIAADGTPEEIFNRTMVALNAQPAVRR